MQPFESQGHSEYREPVDRKRKRQSNSKVKTDVEAESDAESEADTFVKRRQPPVSDETDYENDLKALGLQFHYDNVRANLDTVASDLVEDTTMALSGLAMGSRFDGGGKMCPPNLDPPTYMGGIQYVKEAQSILGVEADDVATAVRLPYMKSTLLASQVSRVGSLSCLRVERES